MAPRAQRAPSPRTPRRRATVYLAVLALAMLAMVIGMGGIMSARARRGAAITADAAAARSGAISAIQLARLQIYTTADWRTTKAAAAWITDLPFDGGTISASVTNPLGALNRSSLDPVEVVGTGVKGQARQKIKLTLQPSATALSCLNVAWCAGGTINVLKNVTGPGLTIATNSNFVAAATVNADVEAAGTASGATYSGSKKSGQPARAFPSITSVIAEYSLIGSVGSFSGIPRISGDWLYEKRVISPALPPFGAAANARGVYILDCAGKVLVFNNIRVVGTIVLLNCGGFSFKGPVCWKPAVTGYPCMVVQGSITLDQDATALSEAAATYNLNPASTPFPYPTGQSNATNTDYYPCGFNGLVYASGNLTIDKQNWSFGQVVVNGALTVNQPVSLFPAADSATSPPPGFADVKMIAGAWEKVVD